MPHACTIQGICIDSGQTVRCSLTNASVSSQDTRPVYMRIDFSEVVQVIMNVAQDAVHDVIVTPRELPSDQSTIFAQASHMSHSTATLI